MALNKHSPVPLYYQLAEQIREQIRSGALGPGEQLPSERVLSEQHAISRMTVRQALAYLVREGALVARHGLGTFVAEPKLTYDALHLLGFTEEIMRLGGTAVSQVLEQRITLPPPRVAQGLDLAPGAEVVAIVRLRLSDATPLLLETIYMPAALCPGLEQEDLATHSLYAVLEARFGLRLRRARQVLEATVANDYEAGLFGIARGTPMILLEGVTYDDRERPAEYFKAIYRGDRFKFAFDSERGTVAAPASASKLSVVLA
ncbi:MAG TPA: GntR family transcriptional regulator [Roseiflexaceae bacterium]|nr:GntR family transcriptional regulator [Roseiflexaceae bacterium]